MNIFVGCSSDDNIDKKYRDDCSNYLKELLKNNNLVFGAYNSGLMGLSYEITHLLNGEVIGVCSKNRINDLNDLECSKKIITEEVIERTKSIIKNSDVLVFLPGGLGTMHELFTAIECKRCNEFDKPIIIYNSCGYYDKLLILLEQMYKESFMQEKVSNNYYVSNSVIDTISYIKQYYNKSNII